MRRAKPYALLGSEAVMGIHRGQPANPKDYKEAAIIERDDRMLSPRSRARRRVFLLQTRAGAAHCPQRILTTHAR